MGVELDEPVGKTKGKVKGHQYFKCVNKGGKDLKYGVLVTPDKVGTPP